MSEVPHFLRGKCSDRAQPSLPVTSLRETATALLQRFFARRIVAWRATRRGRRNMTDDNQPKGAPPGTVITPGGPRPSEQVHRVGPDQAVRQDPDGSIHVVSNVTSRSTTMPDTLVPTPGGYRPQSMVFKIEAGHKIDASAGRLRMLTLKGDQVKDFGAMAVRPVNRPLMPANVVRQPLVQIRTAAPDQPRLLEARLPGLGTGWITYAWWSNGTGSPITYFATRWVVPPHPQTRSGQLLYLFNGIQNSSFIYQPVLQWGSSPAGGGDHWSVASWYVDGMNGPAFHSDLVDVNPGDVVVGVMTQTGNSAVGGAQLFHYDCQFQGLPGAGFPVENIEQ